MCVISKAARPAGISKLLLLRLLRSHFVPLRVQVHTVIEQGQKYTNSTLSQMMHSWMASSTTRLLLLCVGHMPSFELESKGHD